MQVDIYQTPIKNDQLIYTDRIDGLSLFYFNNQGLYTILIINPENLDIHFLIKNVPGQELNNMISIYNLSGNIISEFTPLETNNQYQILVYQQSGYISTVPQNLDLRKWITNSGMSLADQLIFELESDLEETLPESDLEETLPESDLEETLPESDLEEPKPTSDHTKWLKPNPLTIPQQKFCRCIIQVASKQPEGCIRQKAYREHIQGKTCSNPYPICAKSIGTTSRNCTSYYNFEAIPDQELIGYARLEKIPVPRPYDRQSMLNQINNFVKNK